MFVIIFSFLYNISKFLEFQTVYIHQVPGDNTRLLANSLEYPVEDPERIRVDSVFETCACLCVLCLLANLVTFCTIKYYSAVQYSMVT